MKIAVIAAGGRSGQVFVKAALAAGHTVRAGVRGESSFSLEQKLTIIKCDAAKEADLKKLLFDCDAVVSLIGHVKGSPPDIQTVAIQHTINIMNKEGIKRLVSLTGTGVRFAGDKITIIDRILNLGISLIDPKRVKDGKLAMQLIKNSNLDWTVVRVLKLQDVAAKPYVLRKNGPTKVFVGRAQIAQAILEILENHSFILQAPIIGN